MKELYAYLTSQEEVDGVRHEILSQDDWDQGNRLIHGENMSLITPDLNGSPAQQLLARYCLRAKAYDLAIHPHGVPMPNSEVAIYGPTATPLVKQAVTHLGLSRAIIRPEGAEAILENSFVVEIGPDSDMLNPQALHEKVTTLLNLKQLPPQAPIEEYILVGEVTKETALTLKLQPHYGSLEALTEHDNEALCRLLGARTMHLFAYCWDSELFDAKGHRGELLTRWPLETSYDPTVKGFKDL